MEFVNLPVVVVAEAPDVVEKVRELVENARNPVFLYCRSGTRCTQIWALGQIGRMPKQEILRIASGAGYDLSNFLKDY